jgi:WD40 repeat protein
MDFRVLLKKKPILRKKQFLKKFKRMNTPKVEKIAKLTGHKASIFSLTAAEDERHFFSGAGDGWVVRWNIDDPETGRLVAQVDAQIFSMLFLENANKIVVGNMNGGVHWVDLAQPEQTKNIAHHKKGVFDIIRLGDQILTAGGEGKLTRWSIAESRSVESFHLTNQSLRCLDYSPLGNLIAAGASDNAVYILDGDTLEVKNTIPRAHDNSVFAVKFSPDGRYLITGGRDAHLKVWGMNDDLALVSSQAAHWYTINHIAYHPEGKWFATASRDKTIKIWDAANFQLLKVLDVVRHGGHINSVNRLFWSPYDNLLISGSDDRSIIIWDMG